MMLKDLSLNLFNLMKIKMKISNSKYEKNVKKFFHVGEAKKKIDNEVFIKFNLNVILLNNEYKI